MDMTPLFPRGVASCIAEALLDTPAVLVVGSRQAKTILVRQIAEQQGLRYLMMDDELTLLSAREDPVEMIRSLDRTVIDEIQRDVRDDVAGSEKLDQLRQFLCALALPAGQMCNCTQPSDQIGVDG